MTNYLIHKIDTFIKNNIKEEIAHDYNHLERVCHWAVKIAEKESYPNIDLVRIAALLHDIGLGYSENRREHASTGAKMARTLLKNDLSEEDLETITNAIENHDKIRLIDKPSKLLQIIMDADTMELLGAVGIARAFSSKAKNPYWERGNVKGETHLFTPEDFDKRFEKGLGIGETIIDQINFQLSCYNLLQTKSAKSLAKPLKRYMLNFIKQLEKELN